MQHFCKTQENLISATFPIISYLKLFDCFFAGLLTNKKIQGNWIPHEKDFKRAIKLSFKALFKSIIRLI